MPGSAGSARVRPLDGLGAYDDLCSYDEAGTLPRASATLIDVAGHAPVRAEIRDRLGSDLRHTVLAGMTHGNAAALAWAGTWMRLERLTGPDAVTAAFARVLTGHVAIDLG